ncbi:unnamed protein product [Amoebophrya sp. A25]|nr:unnamed protein product [Amoebophrya sp. A25]|eukprot:GSA25T00009295001.1
MSSGASLAASSHGPRSPVAQQSAMRGEPTKELKPLKKTNFAEDLMRYGIFPPSVHQPSCTYTINVQAHLDSLPTRAEFQTALFSHWVKRFERPRSILTEDGNFMRLPLDALDWDYHLKGPIDLDDSMTVDEYLDHLYQGYFPPAASVNGGQRQDQEGSSTTSSSSGGVIEPAPVKPLYRNNSFSFSRVSSSGGGGHGAVTIPASSPRGGRAKLPGLVGVLDHESGQRISAPHPGRMCDLDPSRPLWQAHMIRGKVSRDNPAPLSELLLEPKFKNANVIVFRVHHALADGLRVALAVNKGILSDAAGAPVDFGKFGNERVQAFLKKRAQRGFVQRVTDGLGFAGSSVLSSGALLKHMLGLPKQTLTSFTGRQDSAEHAEEGLTYRKFLYFPPLDLNAVKLVKTILSRTAVVKEGATSTKSKSIAEMQDHQDLALPPGICRARQKEHQHAEAVEGKTVPLPPKVLPDHDPSSQNQQKERSDEIFSQPRLDDEVEDPDEDISILAASQMGGCSSTSSSSAVGGGSSSSACIHKRSVGGGTGATLNDDEDSSRACQSPTTSTKYSFEIEDATTDKKKGDKPKQASKCSSWLSDSLIVSKLRVALAQLRRCGLPICLMWRKIAAVVSRNYFRGKRGLLSAPQSLLKRIKGLSLAEAPESEGANPKRDTSTTVVSVNDVLQSCLFGAIARYMEKTRKDPMMQPHDSFLIPTPKIRKQEKKRFGRSARRRSNQRVTMHSAAFMGFPDMVMRDGENDTDDDDHDPDCLHNDWVSLMGQRVPLWSETHQRPYSAIERLFAVKKDSDWYKRHAYPFLLRFLLRNVLWVLGLRGNQEVLKRAFSRHSLITSNVPGYNEGAAYLLGKKILGIYVPMPQVVNFAMIVSYNNAVFVTMSVNGQTVTRAETLKQHFLDEFQELVRVAMQKATPAEQEQLVGYLEGQHTNSSSPMAVF